MLCFYPLLSHKTMEDKVYPNFPQALVLTIYLMLILIGTWLLERIPLQQHMQVPDFYIPLATAISSVLCIPIVLYALRKSKINILDKLQFPNFKFLVMLFLLAISFKILSSPFVHPVRFFHSFLNGSIEYFNLNFSSLRFNVGFIIRVFHLVVLGPVIEEVFFRRILLSQFLKKYNVNISLLLSAFLFTISHFQPNGLLILFIYGLIFGYFFYRTNSLIACILLHSFSNLLYLATKFYTTDMNDITLTNLFIVFSASILIIYLFEKNTAYFQKGEIPVMRKK
jgi:hypothetical protein